MAASETTLTLNSIVGGLGELTPSDGTELGKVTRQIYIGGAGNIAVVWANGTESVEPVAAGERLDWAIRQLKATGTTATGVRGFY